MSVKLRDTSPEATRAQIDALRSAGVAGRARTFFSLCELTRRVTEAGIRHRHPDYSDDQVQLAATKLRLGAQLFAEAFPGVNMDA